MATQEPGNSDSLFDNKAGVKEIVDYLENIKLLVISLQHEKLLDDVGSFEKELEQSKFAMQEITKNEELVAEELQQKKEQLRKLTRGLEEFQKCKNVLDKEFHSMQKIIKDLDMEIKQNSQDSQNELQAQLIKEQNALQKQLAEMKSTLNSVPKRNKVDSQTSLPPSIETVTEGQKNQKELRAQLAEEQHALQEKLSEMKNTLKPVPQNDRFDLKPSSSPSIEKITEQEKNNEHDLLIKNIELEISKKENAPQQVNVNKIQENINVSANISKEKDQNNENKASNQSIQPACNPILNQQEVKVPPAPGLDEIKKDVCEIPYQQIDSENERMRKLRDELIATIKHSNMHHSK